MTDSEAREILELSGDEPTREQIRRAYMRKLKAHPPERDPEGFQRLRTAYEYLLPAGRGAGTPIAIPAIEIPAAPIDVKIEPSAPALVLDQPFAPALVELLLECLRDNNLGEADALAARIRACVADDRDQLELVGPARWVLISELVFVARQLPTKLVRALVRALTDDDIAGVEEMMHSEMKWDPAKVDDLDRYLSKRAPNLWLWATGRQPAQTLSLDPKRVAVALGILAVVVALIAWSQC